VGRPRRDADEPRLVSPDLARRLVVQAREEGLDIAGDAGLLGQMMKSVLEAALAEELTDHLGYEHGDPGGRGSGNSRNGSTPKTLLTEAGAVELETRGTGRARSSRGSCARASAAWTASTRSCSGSTRRA
jgi:putative transposase